MSRRRFALRLNCARPAARRFRPLLCEALESRALLAADFAQFIDPNPAPRNEFGQSVVPLNTGNVVVTSPFDDAGGTDAGAVYLFNGATGALISTLTGSRDNDRIGLSGVTPLGTGNFVVSSRVWNNGAGAATLGNGTTGINGTVNVFNSLVGRSAAFDQVSEGGVIALANGNYVVRSPRWDNGPTTDAGAVTWGNGAFGISGQVSAANSLVGNTADDSVGSDGVVELTNGNYVVRSPRWDNAAAVDAGAVTFGNGTTGISGIVSAGNSLVGSTAEDLVGRSESDADEFGVIALTNGNYVVASAQWHNGLAADVGAVTFASGTSGISGVISAANSLLGSAAGDNVGRGVFALSNGNYVVTSPGWGGVDDVGAVTLGDGAAGITGAITSANSLVGSTQDDRVGLGGVTALANGNYVVISSRWNNGAADDAGAVTFVDRATGKTGAISSANSLVGSTAGDEVGFGGVTALVNGNYVVRSPFWDNGAAFDAGAATFGNGATGISGIVSAANSLVGSTARDEVGIAGIGIAGVTALANGNYVVLGVKWDNGPVPDVGAATFGDGVAGISGAISSANSLVGGTAGDQVGERGVTALPNGNYVVSSPLWDNGPAGDAGAVTFGNGVAGVRGTISGFNSLLGSTSGDQIGTSFLLPGAGITVLTNGNYVVTSQAWDNGAEFDAGAVTFGSGTAGVRGVISAANSLVGSTAGDQVGLDGATALSNGNYVVRSRLWDNAAPFDAGAVTFGRGTIGVKGEISSLNSAIGEAAGTTLQSVVVDDQNETFFGRFLNEGGGIIRVGSQRDGFNAKPVIGSFGGAISYTENADPARIAVAATIYDPDSPNFAGGTLRVALTANAQESDRLGIRTVGTDPGQINVQGSNVSVGTIVIGTLTGGAGTTPLVVSLNDNATPSRVQNLLRQITYHNISENPPAAARTVRVTVSDGDGETSLPGSKQINVVAINDAPVLPPASGGAVGYQQNSAQIALLSDATVTDPDSANFAGGRLLVRIISGGNASNRLLIGGAFELDGDQVKRRSDGLVIGSRNAGGGVGTTRLEITFNANATRALVQQLVRGIRFRTVSGTSTVQRVIEFSVSDGDGGGASNKVNKTVNVS